MAKAKMTVKVLGGKELAKKLKALSSAVAGEHLAEAVMAGAEVVRAEASQRAPKRTGKLSKSIVAEVAETTAERAEIDVGPNKEAFYGLFVEVGTSKMSPKPFLRPALDEKKKDVEVVVRDELKRRLGL